MTLIKPCTEDENLITGEILLNIKKFSYKDDDFIKIKELHKLFKKYKNEFQDFKCSETLGVISFTFSDKKVIITKIGRITIQKAKNKQDLLDSFTIIINLLIKYNLLVKIR